MKIYKDYIIDIFKKMVEIHSPLGYHHEIVPFVKAELKAMGYECHNFKRGGFYVQFGEGKHIAISAHLDEIGVAIRKIKSNGRMLLSKIGGIYAKTLNEADCEVVTLENKKYSATIRHNYSSVHLSENFEYDTKLDLYTNMELILDEMVKTDADVKALGINCGDFVLLDPKTKILENGFIKSRFIDDKICIAIMLAALKYLKDNNIKLNVKTTWHFSVYEENGTGGATGLPYDIDEMLALDIGCIGNDGPLDETMVSIVAQDSRSHYSREMIQKLVKLANKHNLKYNVDTNYPHYGSDTSPAISSGHDLLFGLIGPGTYASHGYERTHIEGVLNTFELLMAYLKE